MTSHFTGTGTVVTLTVSYNQGVWVTKPLPLTRQGRHHRSQELDPFPQRHMLDEFHGGLVSGHQIRGWNGACHWIGPKRNTVCPVFGQAVAGGTLNHGVDDIPT